MKKEMIKAIRMVKGWNPDLRVRLTISQDKLWDWLDENRFGIFGSEFGLSKPAATSPDWEKYERAINAAVRAVVTGRGE